LQIQASTLQRLGYILVKQGFISDGDLEEALRIQVTQIVYRLFRWREGKYQFTPMDHVEYDNEHFRPLSAETILMEGARMIDEWPILERRVRSASMVFRKTPAGREVDVPVESLLDTDIDFGFGDEAEGKARAERVGVSREERSVLHMVDGRSSVQDIVDASALGEFDVYHTLYALLDRSLIEEAPVSAVAAVTPEAATRDRWLSGALVVAVIALALVGLLTLPNNPLTPARVLAARSESETLRSYASRNRVGRLERGIETYYLDRGAMPERLEQLAEGGYVLPVNLADPWGRPYRYERDATGYTVAPEDGAGADLAVRHRFTRAQRMLLEGGLPDRSPSAP
ncbi:MAG TPA: DUF4388 domain-containing protein, partial [Candidatus Polarisedimenticolaceae bacterium]|nr:DUF4388 domain-containing protein [Candidatus Polarisedimenticolaceae bacterium]